MALEDVDNATEVRPDYMLMDLHEPQTIHRPRGSSKQKDSHGTLRQDHEMQVTPLSTTIPRQTTNFKARSACCGEFSRDDLTNNTLQIIHPAYNNFLAALAGKEGHFCQLGSFRLIITLTMIVHIAVIAAIGLVIFLPNGVFALCILMLVFIAASLAYDLLSS